MRTALILFAVGCTDGSDDTAALQWWEDPCGRRDPVDQTCDSVIGTIEVGTDPTCTDEGFEAGDACTTEGATCIAERPLACEDDPKTIIASDAVMVCDHQPPEKDCPISRRDRKTDIAYLDATARSRVADQALALRLATYVYTDPRDGVGPQLGYVLDDAPDAVFGGGERVNLYAYTSAVLAAVQEQAAEIARLEERIDELESGVCATR